MLFPVKPLDALEPNMSWRQEANLTLIERSANQLAHLPGEDPVAVPLVGCGNGGLDPADVRPILDLKLKGDRFVLVLQD